MSAGEYKMLIFSLQERQQIPAFHQKPKPTLPSNVAEVRTALIKTASSKVLNSNIKNHFICNLQICKVSGYLKLRSILLTNMKHY